MRLKSIKDSSLEKRASPAPDTLIEYFLDLFSIKTSVLWKTLENYKKELRPEQMNKVMFELIQLAEMYAQKLLVYTRPYRRVRYVQNEISRIIRDNVDTESVSCKKGCSHCCHWPVEATLEEAETLLRYSKANHINIDQELLKLQFNQPADSEFWQKAPIRQRRCVFLSDSGGCQAYKVRPASCRKCLVYSDPELCKTPKNKKITPLVVLEAEVLTSLSWSVSSGDVGLLPKVVSIAQEKAESRI